MSDTNTQTKKRKKFNYRSLIKWVVSIFLILMVIGIWGILVDDTCTSCAIYKAIGFGVIMLWTCIFICYFIWSSYFYNINYGITDEEWEKIYEAKRNRAAGKYYGQHDIEDEPLYNPYSDQTFGLPPGTVRGMIAFTLLFGAIALLIVSFGMDDEISPGNFFRDQFEFFKTAFLMMIAFYFGARSLKYLGKGEQILDTSNTRGTKKLDQSMGQDQDAFSDDHLPPEIPTLVHIDSSDPLGEKIKTSKGQIPPITAIDPMAKK